MNVIDYRMGIPEDRHQKLVMPFTQTNKGFGIGFMLTYKVIEQHHGKGSI
jgi:nitrogen-specific signal transduction histidine kinase